MEPTAKDIQALTKIATIIDNANLTEKCKMGTPEMKAWVRRYNAAYEKISTMSAGSGKQGGFETAWVAQNVSAASGQNLLELREMLNDVI